MTVNISSDEFSAICDAVAAFENLLESCKEQDDANHYKKNIKRLSEVTRKYRAEWEKRQTFKQIRARIAENRALVASHTPREIDKMARVAMKKYYK